MEPHIVTVKHSAKSRKKEITLNKEGVYSSQRIGSLQVDHYHEITGED